MVVVLSAVCDIHSTEAVVLSAPELTDLLHESGTSITVDEEPEPSPELSTGDASGNADTVVNSCLRSGNITSISGSGVPTNVTSVVVVSWVPLKKVLTDPKMVRITKNVTAASHILFIPTRLPIYFYCTHPCLATWESRV